jgi:3-oxoacyl-[acyl-carrier protein] reductase
MTCKGRVAIVSGAAGRAIGRSIALTLGREGASVVVNYRNSAEQAADVVRYIESRGGSAVAVQADVCDQNQCRTLCSETVERYGRVDICVVSPGGGWHPENIEKLDSMGALEDAQKELGSLPT